ncbi:hypothetical protein B484DRAFT_396362, partial [Ochromonadaceae sp. CCMP2298]
GGDVDGAEGLRRLQDNLLRIQARWPRCLRRGLVAVECVCSDERFQNAVRAQVQVLLDWAEERFPGSQLYVGVCNQDAGTPALEKIDDFLRFLASCAPLTEEYGRVLALSRDDMLGFAPLREPDAVSGVSQYLCSAPLQRTAQWEEACKQCALEYVSGGGGRGVARVERDLAEAAAERGRVGMLQGVPWGPVGLVLMVLVLYFFGDRLW